jgi:hypothetical protein
MKYLKNTAGININRKVIFSTDDNPMYYFFMPIVSKLWTKMGYHPHVFIVGNEKHWLQSDSQKQLVLNTSLLMGANVTILDSEIIQKSREFDGYNLSALAQVSRLCSPCWSEAEDSDYYLTSDIDMLPLNRNWLNQQDILKPIHLFYANGYDHSRYAICYLGMNVNVWKQVINIETKNIYVQLIKIFNELKRHSSQQEQWGYDEIFFHRQIKKFPLYPKMCHMINRKIYKNSNIGGDGGGGVIPEFLPIDRLDRSNWTFNNNIGSYVDAHCKRPGYKKDYWCEIVYLLRYLLNMQELTLFDNYYKEFIKYV